MCLRSRDYTVDVALDGNPKELKAKKEISPVSSNRGTTSASTINQRLSLAAHRDLFHNRSVTNYSTV